MTKLILVVVLLAAAVLLQGTNSSPTKRNWDNKLMEEIYSTTEKPTEKEEEYREGEDTDEDDKVDFDQKDLDKDDEENKNMIDEFKKEFKNTEKENPETVGGENIIEGDIQLTPAQAAAFKEGGWDTLVKSEAWKLNHGMWSRYIPYEIDNIEQAERDALMSSITMLQDATCLHFIPRTNEADYLRFVKPPEGGCSSPIGKMGGGQNISLGVGCDRATPAHEIMHSLGRWHEQSRPDRDIYVVIFLDNIEEGKRHEFDIHRTADTQNIPYDYGSLMHYSTTQFSRNGQPTIYLRHENAVIGQRDHLSAYDIQHINVRYCPERVVRLVGGNTLHEGRVEVKWNNTWGTVCDDKFGRPDGKVICKYLGYPGLKKPYKRAHFGQGSGPIWFDNMQCNSSDYGPFSCRMNGVGEHNCNHRTDTGVICKRKGIGEHNCDHSKDAGVTCKPNVRLVGRGSSRIRGRVEVYVGGRWGTVCDDGFGQQEADVICRQLGYRRGRAYGKARFGKGTLPILLDNLQCTGSEQQIAHCRSRPVGKHNCKHSEDASVVCRSYD